MGVCISVRCALTIFGLSNSTDPEPLYLLACFRWKSPWSGPTQRHIHELLTEFTGHFAVKKVAVGESHEYLIKTLREVRLLERLHHPNIITYQ
jgi:hypothetical protein